MTTALMLIWLSASKIEQKDIPLQTYPQVICPMNMDEYLLNFRWWAREDVRKRQVERDSSILKNKI